MRYKSKRGIGELILILFIGALLLLSLYACFVYGSRTLTLSLVLALLEAGMLFFYFFRTEYELTEETLIIREHPPFRGRSIPYAAMKNYRIGGRGGGRMGRLYDIYLIYEESGKERFLILSPENRDDFIKNLRHRSGRSLEEDEMI